MAQYVMLNSFQHLNGINELRDPELSSGRQTALFQRPANTSGKEELKNGLHSKGLQQSHWDGRVQRNVTEKSFYTLSGICDEYE
jgi:hypothetical protein